MVIAKGLEQDVVGSCCSLGIKFQLYKMSEF